MNLITALSALVLVGSIGAVSASPAQASSLTPAGDVKIAYGDGHTIPSWSNGALLSMDGDGTSLPVIHLFDRQGRPSPWVFHVSVPEAVEVFVRGWARGLNGALAVCGMAIDREGRRGAYLATFAPDGTTTKLIRTAQYHAHRVAVAADGTLWTAGVEALDRPPTGSKDPLVDVMAPYGNSGVIRHFDATGKQLGSFIPQATVKDGFHLVNPTNYLVTASNRVAWYCGDARRYVEIDAAGKVLDLSDTKFPDPAAEVSGIALTDSGEAFAAVNYGAPPARQSMICLLDRASKTWMPVRHESSYILLYGSEGDVLVSEILVEEPVRTIRLLRSGR